MVKTKVKSAPKPKSLTKKSSVVKPKFQKVKKPLAESKKQKPKKTPEDDVEIPQKKLSNKKRNKHQKDLEGLRDIDPEFYNFLKTNDKKLLDFDMLESDSEDEPPKEDDEDQNGASDVEEDERFVFFIFPK